MILSYLGCAPRIASSALVVDGAVVIGDVAIGEGSSLWFNVVIRGDVNSVHIGQNTNIQDGSVVHVSGGAHCTFVGDGVTVGHNVTLHGCRIEDDCLIGMGSVVLDGVVVGRESIVGAGAVVPPGTIIPPRTLVVGNPARPKRGVTPSEIEMLHRSAANYVRLVKDYARVPVENEAS